jgi:hypothetical protein
MIGYLHTAAALGVAGSRTAVGAPRPPHLWAQPEPVPRARAGRLLIAAERLEAELEAERRGNAAYEEYRATGRMKNGRRFGAPPKPYVPPAVPEGKVNVTDPDSRYMKTTDGYVQGYNAQEVVTEQQIVLAAVELTTSTSDWSQLEPMVSAAVGELDWAGVAGRPEVALADAQYWNEEHIDAVVAERHIQVLIPPESRTRDQPRPGWTGGRYDWMRAVLKGQLGDDLYRKRVQMVEPVFGQTKHNRGVTRFHRRGRKAVRTEWRLVMATHNLMKLFRHQLALASEPHTAEQAGLNAARSSHELTRRGAPCRERWPTQGSAASRAVAFVLNRAARSPAGTLAVRYVY